MQGYAAVLQRSNSFEDRLLKSIASLSAPGSLIGVLPGKFRGIIGIPGLRLLTGGKDSSPAPGR